MMRTGARLIIGILGILTAGSSSPPPTNYAAACQTGEREAITTLGPLATAPARCERGGPPVARSGVFTLYPEPGLYLGTAYVFWGHYHRDAHWYRRVAIHEEGHAWDAYRLTDAQRTRYAQIRGEATFDREDYADVFAMILGGYQHGTYSSTRPPTRAERRVLAGEAIIPTTRREA